MARSRERVTIDVAEAEELSLQALGRAGLDGYDARAITDHILDAALSGYEYSGLPKVLSVLDDPRLSMPTHEMRVLAQTPVSLTVDGGNHNGMSVLTWVCGVAARHARDSGVALVSVTNTWMSGRCAYFVERLAGYGLVAILTVSSPPRVAPDGAAAAAVGTNPIAFGFPADGPPLVIDFGTSSFMDSDTLFRLRTGRPLPDGVALDADGSPTTDPAAALLGSLTPAGHKGFALAMAIHALAALRHPHEAQPGESDCFLIVFAPELFAPLGDFRAALGSRIAHIEALPKQPGATEIRIPGRRAAAERARRRSAGIELDLSVIQALRQAAKPGHQMGRNGSIT